MVRLIRSDNRHVHARTHAHTLTHNKDVSHTISIYIYTYNALDLIKRLCSLLSADQPSTSTDNVARRFTPIQSSTPVQTWTAPVQPRTRTPVQAMARSLVQTMTLPPVQTMTRPPVQTMTRPPVQTITLPPVQTMTLPPVQTMTLPPVQAMARSPVQTMTRPPVQTMTLPPVQTITRPLVQTITRPPVQTITRPPVQTMTLPPVQTSTPHQTRSNTPAAAVVVDDSENVDPTRVISPVTTTRKRKRPSTSSIDDLYAAYLKKEIEVKDLKKTKLKLEIQLLQRKLAE